ncbi:MAG: hypothetical protein RLZ56_470 [Bacteroidota bacterium]|jgi:hypothetical protein
MKFTLKKNVLGLMVLLFCITSAVSAQQKFDSLEQYLTSLHFNGPINGRYYTTKIASLPEELHCEASKHNYLWLKNKLVVQIDGSGKLYGLDNTKKGFVRMDNTCYEGYNFGAFTFVKNDSIFSLGGYGFWVFNGMLRCYDSQNGQWYVIPSNKDLPLMRTNTSSYYYDVKDKKIYVIYQNVKQLNQDESYQLDAKIYVQCIDLRNNKWWEHPKILNTSKIKSITPLLISGVFHTEQGLLTVYNDELLLIDFKNNHFLDIKPETKNKIYNKLVSGAEWVLFRKDDYLIFYNSTTNKADSIRFNKNDLLATQQPVYFDSDSKYQINLNMSIWMLGIIIIIALFFIVVIIYKLRKRGANNNGHSVENKHAVDPVINHSKTFQENLSVAESLLLQLLIENAHKEVMTSINHINHALGIAQKPLKIQNNIRAAAIQMINKKFMVFSGCNDELIQKERTEFDKRIFEYFLQKKYINKLK